MKGSDSPTPRKRELYVEGGGDKNPSLASECRRAFSKLFDKDGLGNKPRVIACGSRTSAYKQFRDAQESGKVEPWLLVDAEAPVTTSVSPWAHVKQRTGDGWEQPQGATDEQLHFMHVCMETWLAADPDALAKVFGPKFDSSKLPAVSSLEGCRKDVLFKAISAATKPTPCSEYAKGPHSFRALAEVAPKKVRQLTWGARFLDAIGKPVSTGRGRLPASPPRRKR